MNQTRTICLVTSAQPSTNPRLVKEADALAECGFRVEVVCTHGESWSLQADRVLLESRRWNCTYVGRPRSRSMSYWWTRFRNGMSRRLLQPLGMPRWLRRRAISRNFLELERKAVSIAADLYIAHNIEALPAAAAAARAHGRPFGFDAEDFHPGMASYQVPPHDRLLSWLEREYLPGCSYMTAASPGIGEAYARKYGLPLPVCILNVFPLSLRRFISSGKDDHRAPLRLYWMSQTIGGSRGLEDAIGAMGLLQDCHVELHLQGQWQAGYRERFLELARAAGVAGDRIHCHSTADPDRLIGISAGYDIGLDLQHPVDENRAICLTNKIFTYILAGNAVAATATKGQAPLVASFGPAGFLYEPGDAGALAAGLRKWHDDRALLRSARDHAWSLGTTLYNWDREKQRFLNVVDTVLQFTGEPRPTGRVLH